VSHIKWSQSVAHHVSLGSGLRGNEEGLLSQDPAASVTAWNTPSGHLAYGVSDLRSGLERFVFLLGGSDGERLLGPDRDRRPVGLRRTGLVMCLEFLASAACY
jgi:hypothetical protein